MRGLLRNWLFVAITCMLIICFAFYLYMLQDATSQPSKRWSNGILIKEIDDSKVSASTRTRITTVPIEAEQRSLVFWNEKDSLNMISIDLDGNVGEQRTIKVKLGEPVKLKAYLDGDKIYFFLLESGVLKQYCYKYQNKRFYFIKTISNTANDFLYENGNLIVASNKEIFMVEKSGKSTVICNLGGQLLALYPEKTDNGQIRYNLAFTRSNEKTFLYIQYCAFDLGSAKAKVFEIGRQFLGINETSDFDNLMIGASNGKMNIMASRKLQIPWDTCRRLPKGTSSRILLYSFDRDQISTQRVRTSIINEVSSVEPNPVMNYSDGSRFGFISSKIIYKGRKTSSINLVQYEFENGKVTEKEMLTKTKEISREPFWYKLSGREFLQWEDRTGTTTKILLAGTDAKMIHRAGALNLKIAVTTLLDSLMPLGFSLSYLLLIFSCIMLPTFVFIVIISVFFMNWAEVHMHQATYLACGMHVLAEIAMLVCFDFGQHEVISIEPALLQLPIVKILITIVLALVSYYCVLLRFKTQKYDKSFANQYLIFAVINMILFTLLIFPYYYI